MSAPLKHFQILHDRELDALEDSPDDDADMSAVRCVIRELRALRLVVRAAESWATSHQSKAMHARMDTSEHALWKAVQTWKAS